MSNVFASNKSLADKFLSAHPVDDNSVIDTIGQYAIILTGQGRCLYSIQDKEFIAKLSSDGKTLVTKQIDVSPETTNLLDRLEAEMFMRELEVKVVKPGEFTI